ncbi:MAG: YIP1 family protein [Ignavibacteriales bacterium]|nr:YIP1 family protein [Ignavibacteriales bacterium]
MKNIITCKNCGTENPFYSFICSKCNSYLRERIVNIDLWNMIGMLIETPSKAFQKMIYAEHKNFVTLIAFIVEIKLFINSLILTPYVSANPEIVKNTLLLFIFSIVFFVIFVGIFSYKIKFLSNFMGIKTRFKDNFSMIIYSFTPQIFALLFLFPVEIVLFGGFLFSSNPSPFLLKPMPAYIMLGMEILIILWSVLLIFFAIKTTTKLKIFSLIAALLIVVGINLIPLIILYI